MSIRLFSLIALSSVLAACSSTPKATDEARMPASATDAQDESRARSMGEINRVYSDFARALPRLIVADFERGSYSSACKSVESAQLLGEQIESSNFETAGQASMAPPDRSFASAVAAFKITQFREIRPEIEAIARFCALTPLPQSLNESTESALGRLRVRQQQ